MANSRDKLAEAVRALDAAFPKPHDAWKAIKPGTWPIPYPLEGNDRLWRKLSSRLKHNTDKGVKQLAPVIGGRRRYHHRPLTSWLLSNGAVLTLTTDPLEGKVWNNLRNKRHPSMPRIYDVIALKLAGKDEPTLWAIVHERLTWPPDGDWGIFIDTWFRWRAMKRKALSPAQPQDLEEFLRFVIDPDRSNPETVKRQRVEHVLPWQMTRDRRKDIAFRRDTIWNDKGLEEKIAWAKSALKYLRQNRVKFRDFDPSNLAKTKKGGRTVITNLAESRSKPAKTGRLGSIRGASVSGARPVPIDKKKLAAFVTYDLVPSILKWLEHRPNQEDPIGNQSFIAAGSFEIESVPRNSSIMNSEETIRVDVEVQSRASTKKGAGVLAGSASKLKRMNGWQKVDIKLVLNGAFTPAELLGGTEVEFGRGIKYKENRFQPLDQCTHISCIPFGLYSTLLHEVTHAADSVHDKKWKGDYYDFDEDGNQRVKDEVAYINDPIEVRAFMQQVVDEVVRAASKVRRAMADKPLSALVHIALKLSTTWSLIKDKLQPRNQAKIKKAVFDALESEGLLVKVDHQE